jgi:DNA primase
VRYSERIIEEVRLKSSLSELVAERTELKRTGNSSMACCPFHSEKTPSFHINEEQGLYYCFGCGKKGNTFTFVMETRGLSFPESVRYLAKRYSVPLPVSSEPTQFEKGLSKKKTLLRKILIESQGVFEDILWGRAAGSQGNSHAREILNNRDITDQTIKRYRVGCTGIRSGFLFAALKKIISQSMPIRDDELREGLISLGLLKQYSDSNTVELFRDRIMFPIARSDGSPIAFGGRTTKSDPDVPKYINSPESPVYEKRRSFYGLPQALPLLQKTKTVYLVEGYTDVLSFHQIGLENTIAVCGTALTPDHARILSRFISRAYLVFDADPAGRMASAKAFTSFMNTGIEAIPVFLPPGEDPDSIARIVHRQDMELDDLLKILKDGETSLLRIFIQSTASSLLGHERGTFADLSQLKASEHGKLAEAIAPHLQQIKNPVERELRIKEVADLLGVSEQSFKNIAKQFSKSGGRKSPDSTMRPDSNNSVSSDLDEAENNNNQSQPSLLGKRLDEVKKQLVVAVLVDPALLKNEAIYHNALNLSENDEKSRYFFELMHTFATKDHDPSLPSVRQGISGIHYEPTKENTTEKTASESEELLAHYHGILVRCGIENEGFLEEALKQLTLGGAGYDALAKSLHHTVERISLANKVDTIRMQEAKSATDDEKMKLIQEKLLMRRSLDKLKAS